MAEGPDIERKDISATDRRRVAEATRPTGDFTRPEAFEAMAGGATTNTAMPDRTAFSQFSRNLDFDKRQDFRLGEALFQKLWVAAPSSTQASDGLGPLYNARSCQSCHPANGRGRPPQSARDAMSMVLRLARPARDAKEQAMLDRRDVLNFPDPTFGEQLQDLAIPGLRAEGRIAVRYEEQPVTLAGGEIVNLRKPVYSIDTAGNKAPETDTTLSPRIANPMIGLGLIEAVHEADILANADPDDRDGDGISGKAALVHDRSRGALRLGRFGWKAQEPDVRAQSASALVNDIGISSPDRPQHSGDCTQRQDACRNAANGVQQRLGNTEAPDPVLALITRFTENLAVPARRSIGDADVLSGKKLFYESGCVSCHMPKYVTRRDAGDKTHAFQLIWPYSDFLLHDMGEGLADGQKVGDADGREWRTQPLWGIGLTGTVSGHTFFLHDGRARNLTEAILWHGGEAQAARDAFATLKTDDRTALIRFLESL